MNHVGAQLTDAVHDNFTEVSRDGEIIFTVEKDKKYGCVKGDGTVIADTVYTAGPFSEGIGIVHQGNDWYFLEENGVKVF